jgi:hypothetical protein
MVSAASMDTAGNVEARERRQDGLQAERQARARRRLLVDQRLHAKGYFEPNPWNAYALNNLTAKVNPDGSIAIQFGGCDGKAEKRPAVAYVVKFRRHGGSMTISLRCLANRALSCLAVRARAGEFVPLMLEAAASGVERAGQRGGN